MFSFHYVDSDDINWWFDRYPNTHSPEILFHPRPTQPRRQPTALYRRERGLAHSPCRPCDMASSLQAGDVDQLNSASNPR